MTQREASKQNWSSSNTIQEIDSGSLQRIADVCEKMAASYDSVRSDRDMYKRWYEEEREKVRVLYKRISALKGVITKMKKKQP